MAHKLIFWRSIPNDVNLGAFDYVAENYPGEILVIAENDFPPERKACGWQQSEYPNVKNVILSIQEYEIRKKIIEENKNEIHILSGIRGGNSFVIRSLIKQNKNAKIVVIAERTAMYYQGYKLVAEKILRYFLYRVLSFRYSRYISAFLPLGIEGIKQYSLYGFNKKKMYNYMYCPRLSTKFTKSNDRNNCIRFLYIGRFDDKIKGVKLLTQAFEGLESRDDWELSFVGGYGDHTEYVSKWAKNRKQVAVLGKWEFQTVCNNMSNYDVCVVPSRYDGWNLTNNQTIISGIGSITSNQAGSSELIEYSESGIVVAANNVKALQQAILYVLNNKDILPKWRLNAKNFQKLILGETVGSYFIDIINYCFYGNSKKPVCPWEEKSKECKSYT